MVRGTALFTRRDVQFLLAENPSTFMRVGVIHRLDNPGATLLELIGVQSGTHPGEDDIERTDSRHGRNQRDGRAHTSAFFTVIHSHLAPTPLGHFSTRLPRK